MFEVDNKDRVMCKLFSTLVMTTLELSLQRHLPVVVIAVEKAHTYLSRIYFAYVGINMMFLEEFSENVKS